MKKIMKLMIPALAVLFVAPLVMQGCQMNTLADDSMVQPSDWSEGVAATSAWVMAGIGTSQTSDRNELLNSSALHLAYSEDGLTWTALNNNNAVYIPTIGNGYIRDPYIFRKNDGTFVLLAANFTNAGSYSYWDSPSRYIYVAYSDDLVTWTGEHLLQVTNGYGLGGTVRHAWSPRAIYNKNDRCYDIYWVGNDIDGMNHVYVTETYNFETVHDLEPHILYDPGFSVTGAYIVAEGSKHYLFARNADIDFASGTGGDIQTASIDSYRDGAFSLISSTYINRRDQSIPVYTETPCVYQLEDGVTWVMITSIVNDSGAYACFETTNISDCSSWKDISSTMKFFSGSQKTIAATVTRITESELNTLKLASL